MSSDNGNGKRNKKKKIFGKKEDSDKPKFLFGKKKTKKKTGK